MSFFNKKKLCLLYFLRWHIVQYTYNINILLINFSLNRYIFNPSFSFNILTKNSIRLRFPIFCLLNICVKQVCLELNNKGYRQIPSGIFDLSDLTCLFLLNNDIERLPDDLTLLENLEALVLTGNNLHSVNRQIFQLPKLQVSCFI